MAARWNSAVQHYMKEHLPLYMFVSILFVIGVIFGALMVNALSLGQKEELSRFLGSFFQTIDQSAAFDAKQSFFEAFSTQFKWIALVWVLGLSVIGLPLVLLLDFLKGVLVGFSVGFLTGQLSWNGLLFALVSIMPQNLILIPSLLICSVTAVAFSVYVIRNRLIQRKGSISRAFLSYSLTALMVVIAILAAALFEAFVTPALMQWVTPTLLRK